MENTKAKKVLIIVLVILLIVCLGIVVFKYIDSNNTTVKNEVKADQKNQLTENKKEQITTKDDDKTEVKDSQEGKSDVVNKDDQKDNGTNDDEDEIKYPTTKGPIFEYNIEDINSSVKNMKPDTKYTQIVNSGSYTISDDRKSIKIDDVNLKFEKQIYHACTSLYEQGAVDLWAVLLRSGEVKYTKNYGENIKDGPTRIIDMFAVKYERNVGDNRKVTGVTIIVVNDTGAFIDLGLY